MNMDRQTHMFRNWSPGLTQLKNPQIKALWDSVITDYHRGHNEIIDLLIDRRYEPPVLLHKPNTKSVLYSTLSQRLTYEG